MKCFMLWFGGASYGSGTIEDDLESFDSIQDAALAFDCRANSWETYYPCVERVPSDDGGPSAYLYLYDPRDESNGPGEPYPDRYIEFGPRGGVRVLPA